MTISLRWPENKGLKRVNSFLLVIILATNGYVIVSPLLPKVNYEIKQRVTKPVKVDATKPDTIKNIDRTRNHLIMPSMQLDEPIYFGAADYLVHKGIWHRPATNTPEKGGNTVLVGHRFTYDGAAVFYNLDKLKNRDDVYFVYEHKIYHYRVTHSEIVSANAAHVEAPSSDTKLTIYTCTPLLTAKDRLVYIADLVEVI